MGLFLFPRELRRNATMAVGKNKGLKVGKKGAKKKIVDPFTRKDWYDVKAPSIFKVRDVGKTLVNRTQGTRIASDGLKGRVYEVSLADLNSENDAERSFRKFKLVCEDVQGKNCLTNFYGMNLTTDKLRSMVKKRQTSPGSQQIKKTCYAKAQQVRQIRKKMVDIITREVSACDLKEVVNKLIPDSIAKDIEKSCMGIYPLHDVNIRKVKVLRKPRFDLNKLMDLHGEGSGKGTTVTTTDPTTGEVVERPEGYEPPVQESV